MSNSEKDGFGALFLAHQGHGAFMLPLWQDDAAASATPIRRVLVNDVQVRTSKFALTSCCRYLYRKGKEMLSLDEFGGWWGACIVMNGHTSSGPALCSVFILAVRPIHPNEGAPHANQQQLFLSFDLPR